VAGMPRTASWLTAAYYARPSIRRLAGRRSSHHRLRGGVAGGQLDAALAIAAVVGGTAAEQHVAAHAPVRTPAVLDLVVVRARVSAVADGEHAMVQVGAAGGREHTRGVELERGLVGLDGDRDGLLRNGRNERILVGGLHIREASDLRGNRAARLARAAKGGVGV